MQNGSPPWGLKSSETVDRRLMIDPAIFDDEKEKIFKTKWLAVGHTSEITEPGDYLTATIADQPIIVIRNRAGELRAFYNTCRHRGAVLAPKRKGNCGNHLQCIYHAWTYDLDGALVDVPSEKAYGDRFEKSSRGLAPVRVDTCGGAIFVCLNEDTESLSEFLGDAVPYIEEILGDKEALGRVRWNIDANWKIWRENFTDGYHILYAHRALGYLVNKYDATIKSFPNGHSVLEHHQSAEEFNPGRFAAAIQKATGLPSDVGEVFSAFPVAPDPVDFTATAYIVGIFPNLVIMATPANSEISMQIGHIDAVDQTRIEEVGLCSSADSKEMREFRRRYGMAWHTPLGKAEGDDIEAWARCHEGMKSHEQVPFSDISRDPDSTETGIGTGENAMRGFYEMYRNTMQLDAKG